MPESYCDHQYQFTMTNKHNSPKSFPISDPCQQFSTDQCCGATSQACTPDSQPTGKATAAIEPLRRKGHEKGQREALTKAGENALIRFGINK